MKKQVSDRIVLDTVKRGDSSHRTVYLDGQPVREFDTRSDDYAYSNADDYAKNLHRKLMTPTPDLSKGETP